MSADRYEINDADHGAIRISHPSAHLPHEFVCIHPGADPWSAFSNGVIRQQSRDIKLLTQMLHDQRLVIDDLEHRRVEVCDENDKLRTDLAAAVALTAARDETIAELELRLRISRQSNKELREAAEQAEARLSAIDGAPTVAMLCPLTESAFNESTLMTAYQKAKMPHVELIARPAKD